jgi:formate C-acetyltransferase
MSAIVLTAPSTSMARARDRGYRDRACDRINLKFNPASIAGEEGMRGLMQVTRAFWELTLWPVQFNVINNQTLIAAQKEPEKYRDLVVRIASYSATLVDLSPAQHSETIAWTEEQMG